MRWSGAFFLGEYWAVYRGPAGDNTPHAHAALQVTLGVDCDVAMINAVGTRIAGRGLVTRAGATHTLTPGKDVVVLLCDPTSVAAAPLKTLCTSEDIVELPASIRSRFPTKRPLANLLENFAPSPPTIDPRLERALAFLDHGGGRRIEAAARHCELSSARLRSLAARQLGVPLTRWQNWRMLRRAGLALTQGASLAEAAQAGGFADQAHFSRTMRSMTGLTPSAAREPLSSMSDPFKTG